MIIQHNIPALNSYNKLSTNNSNLAKNLEKLSSGYRINRAGDDAAGLAISEKMRAQITGLEVATKNAQDGVSLIQTAEGALQEVHSMLNRLVELSSQSANGIYDNATDRNYLQMEVDELLGAINEISKTDFNGKALLDGTLGGFEPTSAITAANITANGVTAIKVNGVSADVLEQLKGFKVTLAANTAGANQSDLSIAFGTSPFTTGVVATWEQVNSGTAENGSVTWTLRLSEHATNVTTAADLAMMDQLNGMTVTVENGDLSKITAGGDVTYGATLGTPAAPTWKGGGMSLQVGDKATQRLEISIADMSAKGLGLHNLSVGTETLATKAVDTVKVAIDKVNKQRDYLGAKQNRLEHTINNLQTTTENLTDAESRIRDTDMAKEMMKYTKNSILVQSAQAMLAQANQLPSSVLNLLY